MAKSLHWRDLVPGILIAAGTAVVATGMLLVGHLGILHGTTMRLYVTSDEARGVIQGTEVWLNGEKIGQVEGSQLLPISDDTTRRVLVTLQVYKHDAVGLRRDTRAQIRPGSSLIGAPVVFFTGGTVHGHTVLPGDTLHADPQTQLDVTRAQFAVAEQDLPVIRADVDSLKEQLFSGKGSLGAASHDARYEIQFRLLAKALRRHPAHQPGTLALLDHSALQAHADHAMATADSIGRLLSHPAPATSFARLQNDSTLMRAARDARADLAATRSLLHYTYGTVGRANVDSAIDRKLAASDASLRAVMSDAVSHPDRYSPF
jgi:hypothetical protein